MPELRPREAIRLEYPWKIDPASDVPLAETQNRIHQLLQNDAEIRALAEAIKKKPAPEAVAKFVAAAERKIGHLRHDIPGWSGNDIFLDLTQDGIEWRRALQEATRKNGWNHSPYEYELMVHPKFTQEDCRGEARHTAFIVMALRDAGYLPKDTRWGMLEMHVEGGEKSGIRHWAPVIYQKDKKPRQSPGYILDSWLVEQGRPPLVFKNIREWNAAASLMSLVETSKMHEERCEFYRQLNCLQKSRQNTKRHEGWDIDRTFDSGFLVKWYQKNAPGLPRPLRDNPEGDQDFNVAKYFLGKNPVLPPEAMHDAYFRSLRDRIAHIAEQDAKNPALVEAGISADKIRGAKDFAALKPQLERFYAALGVDRKPFEKTRYSTAGAVDIISGADLNRDGKFGGTDRKVLAEIFRDPDLQKAVKTIAARGVEKDDTAEMTNIINAIRRPHKPKER